MKEEEDIKEEMDEMDEALGEEIGLEAIGQDQDQGTMIKIEASLEGMIRDHSTQDVPKHRDKRHQGEIQRLKISQKKKSEPCSTKSEKRKNKSRKKTQKTSLRTKSWMTSSVEIWKTRKGGFKRQESP